MSQSDGSRELQSVQALRAIAATSVVIYHIDFIHIGGFGVDIFFVISGFIISFVSALSAEHFLLKRAFRILPLYWLGTLGVYFIALAFPYLLNATTASAGHLAKSMLMVPYEREDRNVFPVLFLGWTLELEVFFYAVFGLALACSRRLGRPLASILITGVALAGFGATPSSTIVWFYTNPLIVEFVFGIGLYAVWRKNRGLFRAVPVPVALSCAVAGYLLLAASTSWVTRIDRVLYAGLPALVVVASLLAVERRVRFPRFVLAVGDASYSLYLFHPYVIELIDRRLVSMKALTPTAFSAALVAVPICYATAYISFTLIEQPSNRLLRRAFLRPSTRLWSDNDSGLPTAPAPTARHVRTV